ncbi:uncharacterized protein LOC116604870 isoform X1 [Nematostella vectensis]|uniref:uncharacterized protein LOC116604870 isoform X1 n=1 Tax=Nematostella vectensis TaxID=45351 RepID=UPI00207783C2|nr:uncharacterized protein LOC116604870 isoform X1 [Nematostella vectensis]XP_048581366.1 uncharacterized protein LOC116604870 isoform X1 [Nematostella vectensis]
MAHLGIISISLFLLFLGLALFALTYGISGWGNGDAVNDHIDIVLKLTDYACLWAGIPTLITSMFGMVTGCVRKMGMFIALLLFDIITCLCNVAMVFLVSFKTCKEFEVLGLSCFKKLTVTYFISALIVAAAMIALLALVSAILAGIKINKLEKESQRRRRASQRSFNPPELSPSIWPMVPPYETQSGQIRVERHNFSRSFNNKGYEESGRMK